MDKSENDPPNGRRAFQKGGINYLFRRCANGIATATGSPWAFAIGLLCIFVWAINGPIHGYSDTWQLVINTATTIITFLMVFLIQNTQNRDTKAIHLKLDELLRGVKGARTTLMCLETMTDEELDYLQREFERLRRRVEQRPRPDSDQRRSPDS
jgi:low affinity Fe/Cu permease